MADPTTPNSQAATQAAELRRLSARLQHLRLLTVHRLAGTDTWVGPPAQQCHDTLRWHAQLVLGQAEHLLSVARRLDWEHPA